MADRPALPLPSLRSIVRTGLSALVGVLCIAAVSSASELRWTPIVKAVQAAAPSVVNIRGEKTVASATLAASQSEVGKRVNGMGTGVVIDADGYIITNHHVVEGVREISVFLADGAQYSARLIERDPETDLAIIKIDHPDPLPVITIGSSHDLMPGESVVAVGNAFGYEHTATRGIISALHRAVQVSDAQYYDDLIQTDASINPGNSGGPLLNIDGQMIGINVAVRAGAQGIGFAIPVDKAMDVAARLMRSHCAKRGWHGVEVESKGAAGDPGQAELVVRSVAENSPGEEAGLQPGDVIRRAGPIDVARALDFHRGMLRAKLGEPLDLEIRRGDDTLDLSLLLVKAPSGMPSTNGPYWELLGIQLKPVPTEDFRKSYQTRYRGGLAVVAVRPGSPAAQQGIRPGDVLVGMHIWETLAIDNVEYVCTRPDLSSWNPVKFYILRGNETLYGFMPIPVAMRATHQR